MFVYQCKTQCYVNANCTYVNAIEKQQDSTVAVPDTPVDAFSEGRAEELYNSLLDETTSTGGFATSMNGGNGFANGGPGTIKRVKTKKVAK